MIGEDGHFNLFINEEFEMREKEKLNDKEGIEGKNVFLKRTSNLGELFDKEERPWYGSKNRQMSKYEEALENQDSKKTKEDREKKDVKIMLKIGKQRLIFLARMNTDKEFGKVVFLDEKEEIKEKEEKHKDKKERKEKKEKKHKSHKKSKKDKKDKKEMKKLLKEQKLREIEALIDYQNRKM